MTYETLRLDPAKAERIRNLYRHGTPRDEIARVEGVSKSTVRRYISGERGEPRTPVEGQHAEARAQRRHGRPPRGPLYDPREHELEPMSLTAEHFGDPRPGRRELVDAHATETAPRQPWRPQVDREIDEAI